MNFSLAVIGDLALAGKSRPSTVTGLDSTQPTLDQLDFWLAVIGRTQQVFNARFWEGTHSVWFTFFQESQYGLWERQSRWPTTHRLVKQNRIR